MDFRYLALPLCLFLAAATAAAAQEISCAFVTECIETERCEDTAYNVTIAHKVFTHPTDGMDASAEWTDDAVTRSVFIRKRPDILFAMWAENDGREFGRVMADAEGEARYVVMDSSIPMMITYYGTCEALE